MCYQQTLNIEADYRKAQNNKNERFLFPLNEITNFKVNKYFRQITKNIPIKEKNLTIKGRKFISKTLMMVFRDLFLKIYVPKTLVLKIT